MNGFADPHISPATADVAQILVDVLIAGFWKFVQKICGRHDLPGLAIAALRNIVLQPRLLYGMELTVRRGKPFNRRDRLTFNSGYGSDTRALCLAIDMHRTGTALTNAATKLGPRQIEVIPKHPQQRCVLIPLERTSLRIHLECDHVPEPLNEVAYIYELLLSDLFQ